MKHIYKLNAHSLNELNVHTWPLRLSEGFRSCLNQHWLNLPFDCDIDDADLMFVAGPMVWDNPHRADYFTLGIKEEA